MGQIRLKSGPDCSPPTVSDPASRYVLAADRHPETSPERPRAQVRTLLEAQGLPKRIKTDIKVLFASSAPALPSQLPAWWIEHRIQPELPAPSGLARDRAWETAGRSV